MTKINKRLIAVLAVTAAVGAVTIASSIFTGKVSHADSEQTDKVRLVDDRKLPEQWLINAAYGRGALSNLRAAVGEIENHNTEEARKGVAVAQSLLAKIRPEEADYILVHSEVRVLGDVDPGNPIESKLENIQQEFEMNDHEAIITALGSLNIPLAYTRIELPLGETIDLVKDSLQAFETQDVDQARLKLMQIGDALRIETVQMGIEDSPSDPGYADDAS
jgi:hypothetical protein